MKKLIIGVAVCILGGCASSSTSPAANSAGTTTSGESSMKLGNFSISLAVKDVAASRAFYEKLGFRAFGNTASKNMVIMQNDTCTIGLFHGMFDKNTLTFNPGWDSSCRPLSDFEDVREIQKTLKARGLSPMPAADESAAGPAFMMLIDPDGNPVLLDQHVPAPAKK